MKKILLFSFILVLGLFLVGCVVPSTDIKDIEVNVIGFEQDVYCGAKTFRALNGEDYKCTPACDNCCPNCPFCESCCGQCEECPECEACEECPECEACEECPECEACEECPECEACEECPECPAYLCCNIKWGDLLIDFQMWNIGNVRVEVSKICFTIRFDDGTEIDECIDLEECLLVGEDIEKEVKIKLPTPIKRVVLVTPKSCEFY